MTFCFGEKFELGERIGSGSFGEIYLTKNVHNDEVLATKLEKITKKGSKSQLRREAKIYQLLHGSAGIPSVKWFGETEDQNILVMDLLGQSLEDLFNYCNRQFSLKTVLLLAYELVSRIEIVHSQGKLIHRDIKPENFLMGRGKDRHTVYIIDFGLAKYYCNPRTGRHVPSKEGNSLTGTARYASLNAHRGQEQSRRDDLFSIGYVLMYFLRGSLPWQGLKTRAQLMEEEEQKAAAAQSQHQDQQILQDPTGGVDNSNLESAVEKMHLEFGNLGRDETPAVEKKQSRDREKEKGRHADKREREREDHEKYRLIMEKKAATPFEELCAGFPEEFQRYFEHLETLSFEDTPDYAFLKSLFKDLFRRRRFAYDHVLYDWEVLARERQQPQQQQQQQQPQPQQGAQGVHGPAQKLGHDGQGHGQGYAGSRGAQQQGQRQLYSPRQPSSYPHSQQQHQGQQHPDVYRRPR